MQLVSALRENSSLSSELNNLQLNSKSQREISYIQQNNNLSKLKQELENMKFRSSKLEVEIQHYKKIYGDLTARYNKEKSENHMYNRRQNDRQIEENKVYKRNF